jgi:ParB-like chromosome segregation protein Spo0J
MSSQSIPQNELVPVSALKPNPQNPKTIKTEDFVRLKRQLSELKVYKPILVDKRTGLILGGHSRAKALEALGIEQVWVSYVETSNDAEALKYMLSDNDQIGRYDDQLLAELVTNTPGIELDDYKVDLGEPIDLEALLMKFSPSDDPEPVPAAPKHHTCPDCGAEVECA